VKDSRLRHRIAEAKRRKSPDLNLGSQNVRELPAEIGELTELKILNLKWNKLTKLPTELGNCTNLHTLELEGNNLRFPPPEIVSNGTQAVLTFLRAGSSALSQQWVSKLLIVGEGGVGKTQLLRHLRGLPFDTRIETTHGIEIHPCELPHPNARNVVMTLNAWDFGGQQIYHATHQFFLTNRSLFLLAWNARTGYEQGRLHYWLETITALAPNSPILLVATHTDQRDADVPIGELKRLFPRIVGHVEVSNATAAGVEELRNRVAKSAATLPLMGEEWPTHWLTAAQALRRRREKYMKPRDLAKVLSHYQVLGDEVPVLTEWLHDLGDILHYPQDDDLRDLVLLKPQWVAKHISRVFEHQSIIDNAGIFMHQDMDVVWPDIDDGMRQHFLRLMERFDLSYRTLENREISLVVERLPLEVANYRTVWDQALRGPNAREISMIFQLSAVPAGIPTWFIARQHRFTTHTHWRTGAMFTDSPRAHKALISVDNHNRVAELRVRGPHPHDFFALLRDGFELTLQRFPGLGVRRLLPCPGHGAPCSHLFDYAHVLKAIDRKPPMMELQCPESFENVSVPELLFGINWRARDAVIERIEEARNEIVREVHAARSDISTGLENNVRLMQREFLKLYHGEQRLVETQCPNVFTLTPVAQNRWRRVIGERVAMQLYCQAPGAWHPTRRGGRYEFTIEATWLRRTLPYLSGLLGVLKLAAPFVGPTVGIVDTAFAKQVEHEVKLMEKMVDALPTDFRRLVEVNEITTPYHSLKAHTSRASLRSLRLLLESLDAGQQWGELAPILTPEGHLLWLCDTHATAYDI
jgi:internalin A